MLVNIFRGRRGRLAAAAAALVAAVSAVGVATASADDSGDVTPNVIGGNAPTQDYPGGAFVSLKYDAPAHDRFAWHTCGGYLVYQNTVVTNAHCVTDLPDGVSVAQRTHLAQLFNVASTPIPVADKQFWVRAGSPNKDQGGYTAQAKVVWIDPDWDWGLNGGPVDDIAVLKLDHSLTEVQPVQLAAHAAKPRTRTFQLGWGLTNPDMTGPLPTMVQELRSPVIPTRRCADAGITVREICVDNPNGTDGACSGDSGGPALVKQHGVFRVVGGVSRSANLPCGAHPTVFMSTPQFRQEIYAAAQIPYES